MDIDELARCTGFEWDAGNSEKNWDKHKVTRSECEQVFFNHPLVVAGDAKHSRAEQRYYALGQTNKRQLLFLVFTVRGALIRVIFERDMNRSERSIFDEEETPEVPK